MNLATLEEAIADLDLQAHREFLLGLARPAVALLTSRRAASPGCSKFGGAPDLPASFPWPKHHLGPYRFLGQFDLSQLPENITELPRTGLLSAFFGYNTEGEFAEFEPEYLRLFHFQDGEPLVSTAPPPEMQFDGSCVIDFQETISLPEFPWWDKEALKGWPKEEGGFGDAYSDLCHELLIERYLLGYSFNSTLAFDPSPGPDWRSLLTLNSDRALDWCWHDGDWLAAFIQHDRLRNGDFSDIRATAG